MMNTFFLSQNQDMCDFPLPSIKINSSKNFLIKINFDSSFNKRIPSHRNSCFPNSPYGLMVHNIKSFCSRNPDMTNTTESTMKEEDCVLVKEHTPHCSKDYRKVLPTVIFQ
ncbi:hypothetical protein CEXT_205191 [Caerostris extrusa]|uniref:Uncharacterized protein n=1 Tax=Caerostris extrusa TaxID=172846 RepID=A0AAV4WP20_CAEEX|nr:hypothetical protein CEXT_205191 [Caerostris extrusa]